MGGYKFYYFPLYCANFQVFQVTWYTQSLLSMLRSQEVAIKHVQFAKLLHFLSKYYKNPTQVASFCRVTRFSYSKHLLHVAENSQVDRTLLFILTILT